MNEYNCITEGCDGKLTFSSELKDEDKYQDKEEGIFSLIGNFLNNLINVNEQIEMRPRAIVDFQLESQTCSKCKKSYFKHELED